MQIIPCRTAGPLDGLIMMWIIRCGLCRDQTADTLHRHHQNTRRGNILWKNGVHSSRSLWRLIESIQRSIEVQHPTCTPSFCINLSSANWLHRRWNQFISLHFVQCFFVSFPVMWLVGFVELKGKATGISVPLMLTARIVFLHTHRWSVRKKQPFCVHPLQEPGSDCIDFLPRWASELSQNEWPTEKQVVFWGRGMIKGKGDWPQHWAGGAAQWKTDVRFNLNFIHNTHAFLKSFWWHRMDKSSLRPSTAVLNSYNCISISVEGQLLTDLHC